LTRAHALTPQLHLDPRHVLWLPEARTLVAADLHLGYVWAHRHAGQMLPITAPDDTIDRLATLVSEYNPAQLVLLGDIVHRAIPVPTLREQLEQLITRLSSIRIRWITGNHDRNLQSLLQKINLPQIQLEPDLQLPPHLLTHGNEENPTTAKKILSNLTKKSGLLIMGHEHPAITLHDHVTTTQKFPCFLASSNILTTLTRTMSWNKL
jgi:putative SbcD/Mre11-related phosphoesterase